jgi:uncharacterized protein YjbJ (UPF0337 family)
VLLLRRLATETGVRATALGRDWSADEHRRRPLGGNGEFYAFIYQTQLVPHIMNKNEAEGKGKQIKGKVREEVGKLTDNKKEQIKGKVEQAQGKAREAVGKAQSRNKNS